MGGGLEVAGQKREVGEVRKREDGRNLMGFLKPGVGMRTATVMGSATIITARWL